MKTRLIIFVAVTKTPEITANGLCFLALQLLSVNIYTTVSPLRNGTYYVTYI